MNKMWFTTKRYGWGWVPNTWEGWTLTLVFMIWIYFLVQNYEGRPLIELVIFSAAALVYIVSKKGPEPRWRWGK